MPKTDHLHERLAAPTDAPLLAPEDVPPPIELPPFHLPETLDSLPEVKSPTEWAKAKDTPPWQLAAAATGEQWPANKLLSESGFDEAIQTALGAKAG